MTFGCGVAAVLEASFPCRQLCTASCFREEEDDGKNTVVAHLLLLLTESFTCSLLRDALIVIWKCFSVQCGLSAAF